MSLSKSLIAASILAIGTTVAGCTKEDKVVHTPPPGNPPVESTTTTTTTTTSPVAASSTDPSVPPTASVAFPPSPAAASSAVTSTTSSSNNANVSADLSRVRQELSSLTDRLNEIERKQSSSPIGSSSGSSVVSPPSGGSTSNSAVTGSASDEIGVLRRDIASLRDRLEQLEQTQRGASLSIPPTASR